MNEAVQQKKKMNYAWIVFIGCCCCSMGCTGLTVCCMGVFIIPQTMRLTTDMNVVLITTSFSLPACVGLVTTPFWARQLPKRFNLSCTVMMCFFIVSYILNGLVPTWQLLWVNTTVLQGLASGCMQSLVVPTLLGNWFAPRYRGRMNGIALVFTSCGTFFFSPLLTMLTEATSITVTYIVVACAMAILILPFAIKLWSYAPEDRGLKAYGYDEELEQDIHQSTSMTTGMTQREAYRNIGFWGVTVFYVIVSFGALSSNAVVLNMEFLEGTQWAADYAMTGAFCISLLSIGDIIGKLTIGIIMDKTSMMGGILYSGIFVLAGLCVINFLGHSGPTFLYVGFFLFGWTNSLVSVGVPVLARAVFGNREYTKIYSICVMCSVMSGAWSNTVWAAIFVYLGSYIIIVRVYLGLYIVGLIMAFIASRQVGKTNFVDTAEA